MGIVLGVAVVVAVGWILLLFVRPLFRADRLARLEEQTRRLAAAREGGSAEHPIVVRSPAQVEPRFEREPCPRCGGPVHVERHEVEPRDEALLRRVVGKCGRCSDVVTTWFALDLARPD